jgi:membrane protein implicated in regulation of membrane protease activity
LQKEWLGNGRFERESAEVTGGEVIKMVVFFSSSGGMILLWVIIAVVLAILEGFTLSLITIWFTIGAAAAAVVAFAGGNIAVQVVVFFAVSCILLIFTRPILVKRLKLGREKNNIELIEGKLGLVTEAIEPFKSGLVKVNGIIWTSVGEEPSFTAEKDTQVEVVRVEGVKLIVKKPTASI